MTPAAPALRAGRSPRTPPAPAVCPCQSLPSPQDDTCLRLLVDESPAGLVLMNVTGHATFATAAVTRLMGYSVQEVIGLDLFTLVHPEDHARALETFAQVVATPDSKATTELRCRHKDGSWRWMEAVARNFLEHPAVGAVAVHLWDIAARKEAEAGLRASESRFRRIVDSNLVGLFFWHLDGRIHDANDRFLNLVGYTREELARGLINWAQMTPPDYREVDAAGLREIESTGVCQPFEKEFTRKDGTRVPVILGAATLEGFRDRGFCFVIDVTDRRRMERELKAEHTLLRTLLDHIPDYLYVKDTESRYLLNNRANAEMMGARDPEETVGKSTRDLFPAEIAAEFEASDRQIIETGRPIVNQPGHTVGADGRLRNLLTTKVPLRDAGGRITGLVGISRDITERLALEAQLRQSQKMECVGQLAGGVAHDFNNILTVIHGHTAMLANDTLTPAQRESMEEIARAADRAASLTRQLLAFSRRHILQPRNLDLNDTLAQTAKVLQRVLGEDIALEVRYASNLPPVFADPGMFEQVVLNLAVNARDAMPKGGRLQLALRTAALDRRAAQAQAGARPGTFVVLSVHDSGCGIPPEILEHIFEPFFTTKDVGHGSGLGLATVYGIIQQHQGWITVESQPGHGTRFEIFLPVSERAPVRSAAPPRPARGGETILLVEDEDPLRELVRCILESYGYTVVDAPNGRHALEIWRRHDRSFDLLLTDIVMPEGMTGRDLADALKQEKPDLRILFSSGYSSDIIGKDFVLSEGINFLQKPYNPQTLAETVRHCLDR